MASSVRVLAGGQKIHSNWVISAEFNKGTLYRSGETARDSVEFGGATWACKREEDAVTRTCRETPAREGDYSPWRPRKELGNSHPTSLSS